MFHSARIKLTLWYLLIIMLISISFSVVIYKTLVSELNRVERMQRIRIEHRYSEQLGTLSPRPFFLDPELVEETKSHLLIVLGMINFIIFTGFSLAGYFLAGRTLKPIKEMVEEQKRFVADASHELRTPLTAIKTETEVSLKDKKLNLKSAKETLFSNLEEIEKLKFLTDYFLTLSKYQDANTKLSLANFNLADVIKEVVNRLRSQANKKKINFVMDLDKVDICANQMSVSELVTIFLDNAVKYSPLQSSINISLKTKKNNAIIKIEDHGIGIDAADIPNIFNRFYRADISRSKNIVRGYGLGLAIAKSIVDLHQGKITVESIVDKGSIFTVTLSLKQS